MSLDCQPTTAFAPAGRTSPESLREQAACFRRGSLTVRLLDSLPSVVVILNGQRQIVYANQVLQQWLGIGDMVELIGRRPGEALSCDRVRNAPEGCGTHHACSTCGAVLAILASQEGETATRECRIHRDLCGAEEALDLRVHAQPLEHDGERFSVFTVSDIGHEKRRRSLERLFFHDVLNTAGSVRGFAELLRSYDLEDPEEIFALIHEGAGQIVEEIEAQRTLLAVEAGDFHVSPATVASRDFLQRCAGLWQGHEAALDRTVRVDSTAVDLGLTTDPVLLRRILGNLIKNALEAIPSGESVTLGCEPAGEDAVKFWVHNPGVIPPDIQWQMFRRSFSTKGAGRGLGTYSVKLLTGLLGGETSLSSDPGRGTTVRIFLPREIPRVSEGNGEMPCAAC